ncbi:UTP--glucose-1-phosphate uridylyltransferase GalU [Patescibacteria group bacterium]
MAQKVRKAVIPAAGFGTRFLPATKAMPKEMLPLVDKPVIQYIVEEAVAAGFEEIILITGRNKRAIEDHFDTSYELECLLQQQTKKEQLAAIKNVSDLAEFVYVRQKMPLGLGHAILMAKNVVGDEPFAVFLGDDVIDAKVPAIKQMLNAYEKQPGSYVAVQKVPKDQISHFGVIDGTPLKDVPRTYAVKDMIEKPKASEAPSDLAAIGRYILDPRIFKIIEKTQPGKYAEIQLTDALRTFAKEGTLFAHEYEGEYLDTGRVLGYMQANIHFALKHKEFGKEIRKYLKDILK